jgi:hypothetical protein
VGLAKTGQATILTDGEQIKWIAFNELEEDWREEFKAETTETTSETRVDSVPEDYSSGTDIEIAPKTVPEITLEAAPEIGQKTPIDTQETIPEGIPSVTQEVPSRNSLSDDEESFPSNDESMPASDEETEEEETREDDLEKVQAEAPEAVRKTTPDELILEKVEVIAPETNLEAAGPEIPSETVLEPEPASTLEVPPKAGLEAPQECDVNGGETFLDRIQATNRRKEDALAERFRRVQEEAVSEERATEVFPSEVVPEPVVEKPLEGDTPEAPPESREDGMVKEIPPEAAPEAIGSRRKGERKESAGSHGRFIRMWKIRSEPSGNSLPATETRKETRTVDNEDKQRVIGWPGRQWKRRPEKSNGKRKRPRKRSGERIGSQVPLGILKVRY